MITQQRDSNKESLFIFLTQQGYPMYLQCYTNALRELAKKYNKYTGEEIKLTPHILTYLLYEHGEHGNATKRISTLWGIKIS